MPTSAETKYGLITVMCSIEDASMVRMEQSDKEHRRCGAVVKKIGEQISL